MSDWDSYSGEHEVTGTMYETDFEMGGSRRDMRSRARDSMEHVGQSAQEVGSRAREGFQDYFDRHPLLMGAGALAVGIAVGMLLPGSRQENRWMGEASGRMRERTRETAEKVGDVAKAALKEAQETARSEMEQRGMDPDHLKDSAKEMANDARDVAKKTAEEARHAAEEEAEKKKLR